MRSSEANSMRSWNENGRRSRPSSTPTGCRGSPPRDQGARRDKGGDQMRFARRLFAGLGVVALGLALASCEREQRDFRVAPPAAARVNAVTLSELHPGSPPSKEAKGPYDANAYAV